MYRHVRKNAAARSIGAVSAATVFVLALSGAVVFQAQAAPGDGALTVEVNRDFSGDGVYDAALDPGQSGIAITLTDGTTTIGPMITNGDGQVDFDLSALIGSRFRVDVTIPDTAPDYLEFAPAATLGTPNAFRSATTFVDGSEQTIHVGVWNPNTYAPRNPKVALAQQVQRTTAGTQRSLMIMDWNNRGPHDANPPTQVTDNTAGIQQLASQAETGAVFGTAWDYRRSGLFSAAYAKAYTLYGPGGSGGIYRTDTSAEGTSGNTVLWATVPEAGTSAHQTTVGRDDAFFLAAGSEGLGGLALSEDGATLYAANLNNKLLYSYDSAASAPASPTGSVAIADPGCVGGEWRPFAVTVRDGEVYVGGVCDASASRKRADLAVHILRLDGAAFTPVYSHGLDFARGSQTYTDPDPNLTDPDVATHWNPWRKTWDADLIAYMDKKSPLYPMPLLTSFAFENDGSIVLGFRDRKTDAFVQNGYGPDGATATAGHVSGGDVNKVCLTRGVFEWEGTGACANNATPANSAQPAGRVEFFPGDFMTGWPRYDANVTHSENALGAVLLSPREPDVLSTTMNPTQVYTSSGLGFYDRVDGTGPGNDWQRNALMIAGNGTAGNFGKGSGLGGVSLLAAPAPIQIGNYVWFDANRDGTQGPDEAAVPGATVRLLDADGNVLAETVTDVNGEYYFGGEGGYALVPGAEYIVEFDLATIDPSGLPGSPALEELSFTLVRDPGAGQIHDSNPTPTPSNPLIGRALVTAPDHPGGVDHSIDAGVYLRPSVDIVKYDGREDPPANPVDGPDAVDGVYSGPTAGGWASGVDADTEQHAVEYLVTDGSSGPQPVSMIVTNTGALILVDVTVSDSTILGPDLEGLSCDFSSLGGPATGVTWAGPFGPGDSFACAGSLTMGAEEVHHDIAAVMAQPVDPGGGPFGGVIGDEDPYWAKTPEEPAAPGAAMPELKISKHQAGTGEEADTAATAVVAKAGEKVSVEIPVENTGDTPLTKVVITDRTNEGPAMGDFVCTFPDQTRVEAVNGEIRWAATLAEPATSEWDPGVTFFCSGQVALSAGETHANTVTVTAASPGGIALTDDDPFHVQTAGAQGLTVSGVEVSVGAVGLGVMLVGLGSLLLLVRRRARLTP